LYGLGDSSYEKFCYAGKILARRMLSLGARLLGGDDDEDDIDAEGVVKEMKQLDVNGDGIGSTDDAAGSENKDETGCLAWGDERAPDG
jgi:sulfite reductase alpha subunit-like flavoprotein